jgi:hypothetical protein
MHGVARVCIKVKVEKGNNCCTYRISFIVMIPAMHSMLSLRSNRSLRKIQSCLGLCSVDIGVCGWYPEGFSYTLNEQFSVVKR